MGSTNKNLHLAKTVKNNEYYTQYSDIEKEIESYLKINPNLFKNKVLLCPCDDADKSNFAKYFIKNFVRLGLEELICTCYCITNIRQSKYGSSFNLFDDEETINEQMKKVSAYDKFGKIYRITKQHYDVLHNIEGTPSNFSKIDINNGILKGDGDFRSAEVTELRDKADIIITNPPFSLFREFITWILSSKTPKLYSVIGSINAISYKEVFPHIKDNTMFAKCTGENSTSHGMWFLTTDIEKDSNSIDLENDLPLSHVPSYWYTNIDYEQRHNFIKLNTMDYNIKNSPYDDIRNNGYQHYDNFDAIEVPHVDAIPRDYKGLMGVPVSFFDKYCPEQFEIVGNFNPHSENADKELCYVDSKKTECILENGQKKMTNGAVVNKTAKFKRIIIKNKT